MQKTTDHQRHFKMYKHGKMWLTAGITVVAWQVGGLVSQAANTVPIQTAATKTSVIAPATKSTTLRQSTNIDKANRATVSAPLAPKKSLETTASKVVGQQTESKPQPQPTLSVTQPAPAKPKSAQVVQAQPATVQTSSQPVKAPVDQVQASKSSSEHTSKPKPTEKSVPNEPVKSAIQPDKQPIKRSGTDPTAPTTAKDYPAYKQTTNLDQGLFGTSEWWVDANRNLHIGAGQLADTHIWDNYDPDQTADFSRNRAARLSSDNSLWGSEKDNINKIIFEDTVKTGADASGLFAGFDSLSEIIGLTKLETSQATNMAFMFAMDFKLTQLDLSNFKTANVTNMNGSFVGLSSLETIDVSKLDTHNVTDMTEMLAENANLTQLDLSTLDTHNVTRMTGMLMDDASLTQLNMTHLDTSNVTRMDYMLHGLDSLQTIDVSGFNTSQVVDMRAMFGRDAPEYFTDSEMPIENPLSLDLSNFEMGKVDSLLELLKVPLQTITLGHGSRLTVAVPYQDDQGYEHEQQTTGLSAAYEANTVYDGKLYTGKWVNTQTQQVYTTAELVALYSETGARPVATYRQQTNLEVKDTVVKLGTTWQAADNFVSATNADGSAVEVDNPLIQVDQQPNTQQPGRYQVSYHFVNSEDVATSRQAQTVVTGILLNETSKQLSTVAPWTPLDNVKLAVDATGAVVTTTGVHATIIDENNQVVTTVNIPGRYRVNYYLADNPTNVATMQLTVYNLANVTAKDSAMTLGETWQASDNFTVTDENGQLLTSAAMMPQLTGQPNTQVPGNYTVSYTTTDPAGNRLTVTATVTVAGIQLKQPRLNLVTTANWQPQENLVSAVNAAGQRLAITELQVVVTAMINRLQAKAGSLSQLTVPGTYMVSYQFIDRLGSHQAQTLVTVTSQASVNARDQQLQLGESWQPRAGFVSATDEAGRPLAWNMIKVTGQVATQRPGHYLVSYSYTDAAGNTTTKTTTVTVLATHAVAKPDNDNRPASSQTTKVATPQPNLKKLAVQPTHSNAKLPQTDDSQLDAISTIGLVGLAMTGWLTVLAYRKKHRS